MKTIYIYHAIDSVDGQPSIFAFECNGIGEPRNYVRYNVSSVEMDDGILPDALLCINRIVESGGCYWTDNPGETPRFEDMRDPIFLQSFVI